MKGSGRHSSAVEQLFRKQQVAGSSPAVGSIYLFSNAPKGFALESTVGLKRQDSGGVDAHDKENSQREELFLGAPHESHRAEDVADQEGGEDHQVDHFVLPPPILCPSDFAQDPDEQEYRNEPELEESDDPQGAAEEKQAKIGSLRQPTDVWPPGPNRP